MTEKPLTFESTSLAAASFRDVNLRSSRFENVSLKDAVFSDVSLASARFDNVDLRHVAITHANLEGMTINGILISDLLRAYGG